MDFASAPSYSARLDQAEARLLRVRSYAAFARWRRTTAYFTEDKCRRVDSITEYKI